MNGSLAGPRVRSTSSTSRPVWTMDAAERLKSQDSVKSMNEVRPKRSYLSAAVALLLYGFSFGIAIPAFPAITLGICDGDSALSARYYGIGRFIRYSVEFVASPVAGTMADVIGRKPIFLFCFLCISIEYFTLAVTPDLFTLFICRAVAGLGDSGLSTAYAIVSDIAAFNDDEITSKFGQLTAIIAVSFLCGPLIGGVLADINPRLCLGVSGIVSTIALLVVMCTLEETLDLSSTKDAPPRIIYLRKRLHQKKSEPLSQAGRQGVQDARSDEDPTASSITGGGGYDNEKGLVDTREPGRAARSASSSSGGFSNIDNVGLVELNNTCGCCVPICPRGCATNLTLAWWVTLFTASNPLPAITQHVSKSKVRDLMIVLLILNFSGGISAVFYLYMDYRFHASSLDIGLLLALVGLGSMIASACTGFIIPRFVTEKQAVLAGLVLDGLRLVWFGLAPSFEYLYIMVGSLSRRTSSTTLTPTQPIRGLCKEC
jgi:MFS family permease